MTCLRLSIQHKGKRKVTRESLMSSLSDESVALFGSHKRPMENILSLLTWSGP